MSLANWFSLLYPTFPQPCPVAAWVPLQACFQSGLEREGPGTGMGLGQAERSPPPASLYLEEAPPDRKGPPGEFRDITVEGAGHRALRRPGRGSVTMPSSDLLVQLLFISLVWYMGSAGPKFQDS